MARRVAMPLAAALAGLLAGMAAAERPRVRVLADFDDPARPRTGGSHDALERPPSAVGIRRTPEGALEVSGRHAPGGLAGVWLAFYDVRAPRKQFVDASGFDYLTFRIRGDGRSPRLRIKVADAVWAAKEDGLDVGELTRFLPADIAARWQQVAVPLGGLALDRKALAGLTLVVAGPGEFAFTIDDVALKREPEDSLPARRPVEAPPSPPGRALWHWESSPHVADAARWADFLAFCRRQGIARVWMQLPERWAGSPLVSQLRARLAEAHRAGIAVEALDGLPEHGLREHHGVPLGTVDAVIEFNRAAAEGERFDGVHFDNEIHLLLGWHSTRQRPAFMAEFLELNEEAQRRVRQGGGLAFGVDIPFWWSAEDFALEWGGRRQPIGLHLVERLDAVGVMDYRDRAEGADGIIAHGLPFLGGHARGNARVFIGVETFVSPPAPVWLAVGLPRAQFETALDGPARGLARSSRLDGMRLRAFDDGERVHAGIDLPAAPTADDEARAARALMTIARSLAVSGGGAAEDARNRALAKMRAPGAELVDARPRDFVDPGSGLRVPGIVATAVMLPKITFADDSPESLRRELAAVEAAFARHPSFAGIALHYYDSYRAKVDPRGVP